MRETINFNRKWAFVMGEERVPHTLPETPYWVNLPHTWNAIDGQDGENDYHRGVCWYIKRLTKEDIPSGECVYLQIDGANSSADVYMDARHLAHHDGGYSTWRVNLTDALSDEKSEHIIAVSVDNRPNDHVYPQMADFTFYGGLYRDVKLIGVPRSHFDLDFYGAPGIAVTPKIHESGADVEIRVYTTAVKANQSLRYTVLDAQGSMIAEATLPADGDSFTAKIENVHLWHGRKDPYLYKARAELIEGTTVLDCVETNFGCRTMAIDAERGFLLNGEEYPLRGVSRHQDRWGIGNALSYEHHAQDVDLICEVGANSIRLAHYQHAQAFYDLCDERGLVVWAEIPYISRHMPQGRENTLSQMKELIAQNYNHPCICMWGLSNEITMGGDKDPDLIENHIQLNELAHGMDQTRPTVLAALSMCPTDSAYLRIPDAIAYNHYFGWYGGETDMNGAWLDKFHKEHPDIPIGVSEYGCEALDWHTSHPVQGDYTEEYQAHYHEELIKQLYTRRYIWSTYVWNMFDFGADARNEGGENGQNHKGLVTMDRTYKKDAFYAYKAWLSDEPFVHLCGKRYVDRVEDVTRITVYSNLPKVELFANGVSAGVQEKDDHFFYFDVPNVGETHLLACAGECRDESVIRKADTFNEKYRLKEKGAVLNWFDVTAPDGYFSLNDKIGDILQNAEGAEVLGSLLRSVSGGKAAGFEMTEDMMNMMNGFTVLRLTALMGAANVRFTKEELLALNERLNRIGKG